ncbi:hypothetical protein SADUNF_Sadunf05G0106200 [Salix dunnii]|uniref:Uncharacterized protein n=1 Tax=Salix dunnii TaxID=1413687 RepID=A0A835KAK5_9ROSI|nr:hypothetical protein SADUNF_Sadunf05G0106200 [Salix dunnii]
MIELSSTIPSQIRFLLHTLNEASVNSVFHDLFLSLKNLEISVNFLEKLSNLLNVSAVEKIGIGLALSNAENMDARMFATGGVLRRATDAGSSLEITGQEKDDADMGEKGRGWPTMTLSNGRDWLGVGKYWLRLLV